MADQSQTAAQVRTLDVWIADRNMVYRGVPFTVVADWIQEGRLLESDRVRTAQNPTWQRLADVPLLAPYIPRAEPQRAEDPAEALEKIELDIEIRKKPEEAEDDDVDMIPLIDVSMVLLVFFMMTAEAMLTATSIDIPKAKNVFVIDQKGTWQVSVQLNPESKQLEYFAADDMKTVMTEAVVLKVLEEELKAKKPNKIIVVAGQNVPFEQVQLLTIGIQKLGVTSIQGKVGEKPRGGGELPP